VFNLKLKKIKLLAKITHKFVFTSTLITLYTLVDDEQVRITVCASSDRYPFKMYKLDCNKNYHCGYDTNAEKDMLEKYRKNCLPQILESIRTNGGLSEKEKDFYVDEALNLSETIKTRSIT
jgi:hypothetical protein